MSTTQTERTKRLLKTHLGIDLDEIAERHRREYYITHSALDITNRLTLVQSIYNKQLQSMNQAIPEQVDYAMMMEMTHD